MIGNAVRFTNVLVWGSGFWGFSHLAGMPFPYLIHRDKNNESVIDCQAHIPHSPPSRPILSTAPGFLCPQTAYAHFPAIPPSISGIKEYEHLNRHRRPLQHAGRLPTERAHFRLPKDSGTAPKQITGRPLGENLLVKRVAAVQDGPIYNPNLDVSDEVIVIAVGPLVDGDVKPGITRSFASSRASARNASMRAWNIL